jgi:hypothetical protein
MAVFSISHYVVRNGVSIEAKTLDWNDKDHPYNQIKNQGGNPEEFGYLHPMEKDFAGKSKAEIIEEVISLRRELFYAQFGFTIKK